MNETNSIEPGEYFNILKDKKQKVTDEILDKIYSNSLILLQKYERTNQIDAMKKLLYHLEIIEKEREVIKAGIDTFVYLADIKAFVEKVSDRVVKIIELERYEREIPDKVIETYEKVKHLFTKFFIVFTDYTKEHIDKTKKERDPILFGMFQNQNVEVTTERMYFIGDWEDDYCDLTLDKLVVHMKESDANKQVEFTLRDPQTLDDLRAKIKALEQEQKTKRVVGDIYTVDFEKKSGPSFFRRIRSAFTKGR